MNTNWSGVGAVLAAVGLVASFGACHASEAMDGEVDASAETTIDTAPIATSVPVDAEVADSDVEDGAATELGKPPPKRGVPTTARGSRFFAIRILHLGESSRAGVPSGRAWSTFGYNIDGTVSTPSSTNHCTLARGAPSRVRGDGDNGIDNGFGANLLPMLSTIAPDTENVNANAIEAGGKTLVLEVAGLDGSASQTNTGLHGQLLEAAPTSMRPGWDGTDTRTITSESLTNGTLAGGSTTPFSDVYVAGGIVVAKAPSAVVHVVLGGASLPLTLSGATFSFKKSLTGDDALEGTISGVLPIATLSAAIRRIAGSISNTLCEEATISNVLTQMAQAVDIGTDGANTSGIACNAISLGLGFEAKAIQAPTAVIGTPKYVDPCIRR